MFTKKLNQYLRAALGIGAMSAALMFSGQASALTFTSCVSETDPVYNIADNVTGTSDCTIADASQDFLNTDPITVNETPGFFGITDWQFAGKEEEAGYVAGGEDIGLDITTSDWFTGSWSINTGALSAWDNIMLVFKDGNNTTLVGYLLNAESGDILGSPFECPPFDTNNCQTKQISHVTAYVSGPSTSVPEPGTALMLGLGLLGFGMRKKLKL